MSFGPVDPKAIENASFKVIDAETPGPLPCTDEEWPVLRRMIHASADFELLSLVRFHPRAVRAGVEALKNGGRILADTEMLRSGLTRSRLGKLGLQAECLLNDPRVVDRAKQSGTTRAMAAVDVALGADSGEVPPAIWAIGNAPTALLRLLEKLEQGAPKPALIVGMPVGFINAAESKAALVESAPAPYITVTGRKGGTPMTAAAVNAIAELAIAELGGEECDGRRGRL